MIMMMMMTVIIMMMMLNFPLSDFYITLQRETFKLITGNTSKKYLRVICFLNVKSHASVGCFD